MCLAQQLKQHNLRLKKHSMYILHRIARGETEIDLQNEQKKDHCLDSPPRPVIAKAL